MKKVISSKADFNILNTNFAKGIGIFMMIIHHLFWNVPNIGVMIGGISISQRIGIIGKVCVSIFLILSGIGAYKSSEKYKSKKDFFINKIGKLYFNYLYIVLTSSIIGIIFFYQEFISMIGDGIKGVIYFILTCTGLQYIVGYQGFNGSWWFMSVIILCYILFPVIKKYTHKYKLKMLILCFMISFFYGISIGRIQILNIISWIFPFTLGVYIAQEDIFLKVKTYINTSQIFIKRIVLMTTLILLLYLRQSVEPQGGIAIKIDYILGFIIILTSYIYCNMENYISKLIIYLGKNSMNMYFVHMFVTTYYLKQVTYNLKYPILMVIFVLGISLIWAKFLDNFARFINLKSIFNNLKKALLNL